MQMLLIKNTLVNRRDGRGGVHEEAASIVDVDADVAAAIVSSHKGFYAHKADDPHKGRATADQELLDAAKTLREQRAKPAKGKAS